MTIKELQEKAFENAKAHGFHDPDPAIELLKSLVSAAIDQGKVSLSDQKAMADFLKKHSSRSVAESLALIHSEVSEALEADRNNETALKLEYKIVGGVYDQKYTSECSISEDGIIGKPVGLPSELADIMIRVGDLAGQLNIDLEAVIELKMNYNKTRPIKHGKAY